MATVDDDQHPQGMDGAVDDDRRDHAGSRMPSASRSTSAEDHEPAWWIELKCKVFYVFFLRMAGAHLPWVKQTNYSELTKLVCQGLAVTFIPIVAFGGVVAAAAVVTNRWPPPWGVFVGAALWAILVWTIDRWITAAPDYGNLYLAEEKPHWSKRGLMLFGYYGSRMLLAVLVGFLVAEPVTMAIFNPSIETELSAIQSEQKDPLRDAVAAEAGYKIRQATIDGDLRAARLKAQVAEQAAETKRTQFEDETSGRGGTREPGYGDEARRLNAEWVVLRERATEATNARIAAESTHADQQLQLNTDILAETSRRGDEIDATDDLLSRHHAMLRLAGKNFAFFSAWVGITLALLLIDMMPLLLKIFSRRGLYDLKARRAGIEELQKLSKEASVARQAFLLKASEVAEGENDFAEKKHDLAVSERARAEELEATEAVARHARKQVERVLGERTSTTDSRAEEAADDLLGASFAQMRKQGRRRKAAAADKSTSGDDDDFSEASTERMQPFASEPVTDDFAAAPPPPRGPHPRSREFDGDDAETTSLSGRKDGSASPAPSMSSQRARQASDTSLSKLVLPGLHPRDHYGFDRGKLFPDPRIVPEHSDKTWRVIQPHWRPTTGAELHLAVLNDDPSGDEFVIKVYELDADTITAMANAEAESLNIPLGVRSAEDNIAEVFFAGQYGGDRVVIVTKKYPTTLDAYLKNEADAGKFTLGRAVRLSRQLLMALETAWTFEATPRAHCDVKPHNIGIDHGENVKLFDWGLARRLTPRPPSAAPSARTGIGTLFYAPLEQQGDLLRPESLVAVDVYAWAATLYEMVTGAAPFQKEAADLGCYRGRQLPYVYSRLVETTRPRKVGEILDEAYGLTPAARAVLDELDNILDQALALDPAKRIAAPGRRSGTFQQVTATRLRVSLDRLAGEMVDAKIDNLAVGNFVQVPEEPPQRRHPGPHGSLQYQAQGLYGQHQRQEGRPPMTAPPVEPYARLRPRRPAPPSHDDPDATPAGHRGPGE